LATWQAPTAWTLNQCAHELSEALIASPEAGETHADTPQDELLAALKALAAHMDRAGGDRDGMPECPWCKWQEGDSHANDCELLIARAAIENAEAARGADTPPASVRPEDYLRLKDAWQARVEAAEAALTRLRAERDKAETRIDSLLSPFGFEFSPLPDGITVCFNHDGYYGPSSRCPACARSPERIKP
jgi:hypothetical protein